MQEIRDAARLRAVYQANQKLFQAPPPVMRLLRFEKGEFLSRPFKKLNQFLLVVEGNVRIYDIHENSSFRGVASGGPGTLLGDMEFCSASYRPFYTEAVEPVLCLALPFAENRAALQNDPVFLWHVLTVLSSKMEQSTHLSVAAQTLEERVLLLLQNPQFGSKIEHLNDALLHLHCSRRQLQRVLKKLCDSGQLVKTGRGCYQLVSPKA